MKRILVLVLSILTVHFAYSQTDANIFGHVVTNGEHIAFANIMVKGTTIGTSADETGHFLLVNLPEGKHTIIVQALGYKTVEKEVEFVANRTIEIDFNLESDVFGLDEVVVTGNRNVRNRRASTVNVSTLTPRVLEQTASISVSEGLNFAPGLRMENNCQNCGFNQVRLNGLEGPYTQILINSRPIFSGLMGVYGLELIPANMIERIEVVRGGGSALYGSSAIGGTVNLILKDPIRNTYEFGVNSAAIDLNFNDMDKTAFDHSVRMNTSIISSDSRTGFSIYGFNRNRDYYDATGDGFSEITQLQNTTIGSRLFHRPDNRSKLSLDFFNIREDRRGGNKFELAPHESDITEALSHNINTLALNFDRYFRGKDILSVYASTQYVNRDSYYGDSKSLADYGLTQDLSYNFGSTYTFVEDNQNLIVGVENTGNFLKDKKLGYTDYESPIKDNGNIEGYEFVPDRIVADQNLNIIGGFTQYERSINNLKLSLGARLDNYNITAANEYAEDKSGLVFVPRANILYDFSDKLQTRLSYGKAYRAPQIFDEDLHVETSGSRRVIYRNDPNLTQENSHSVTASIDYNIGIGNNNINFIAEGFYTILENAFVNEFGDPDADGTVVYTRINSEDGAVVRGVNLELNFSPSANLNLASGFTIQQSYYENEHEFDEKRFFRTPNDYGFFNINWMPNRKISLSATGTYTGEMLIPYFGNQLKNPEDGELRTSQRFFDAGFRCNYNIKINGAQLQLFTGVKNIFNSYQSDFDIGYDRDPGYIYGPAQPRVIYIGLNFGNNILN